MGKRRFIWQQAIFSQERWVLCIDKDIFPGLVPRRIDLFYFLIYIYLYIKTCVGFFIWSLCERSWDISELFPNPCSCLETICVSPEKPTELFPIWAGTISNTWRNPPELCAEINISSRNYLTTTQKTQRTHADLGKPFGMEMQKGRGPKASQSLAQPPDTSQHLQSKGGAVTLQIRENSNMSALNFDRASRAILLSFLPELHHSPCRQQMLVQWSVHAMWWLELP